MRLFLAILLDEPFREAVLRHQEALKAAGARGNFSRPENLHLTVAFLGELADPAPVLRAMEEVSFSPFPLTLAGGGLFGASKNGTYGAVYYLSAESGGQAEALSEKVRDALRRAGIPYDTKPFKAHITLARQITLGNPGRLPPPPLPTSKGKAVMTVSRVSLMASERVEGRLVYREIRRETGRQA